MSIFTVKPLSRPALFGRKSKRTPIPTVFGSVEIPLTVAHNDLSYFVGGSL